MPTVLYLSQQTELTPWKVFREAYRFRPKMELDIFVGDLGLQLRQITQKSLKDMPGAFRRNV